MTRWIDAWLERPSVQVRLWATLTVVWILLTPVTMLTSLAEHVSWVSFMSLFANTASCATAWVAAMSYLRARRVDESNLNKKIDHVIAHHPDIPPLEESAA